METAALAQGEAQRQPVVLPRPGGGEFRAKGEVGADVEEAIAQRGEHHALGEGAGARRVEHRGVAREADAQRRLRAGRAGGGEQQREKGEVFHERPPSTDRICPVIQSDFGSQKNSAACAMSSALPSRRRWTEARSRACPSSP